MKVLIRSVIGVLLLAAFPVLAQRASIVELKQPCANVIASLPFTVAAPGRYCLSADLATSAMTGITVNASNVILDCKGYAIRKTSGNPLSTTGIGTGAAGANDLVVRNCSVQGFETGILVKGNHVQVLDNTLEQAMVRGIEASGHDIRIVGNRVLNAFSPTANDFQENISVKSSWNLQTSKVLIMNNVISGSHGNDSISALMTLSVDDVQIINNQILDLKPPAGGEAWAIAVLGSGERLFGNSVMVRNPDVGALIGTADLCTGNVFIGAQTDLGGGETAGITRCETASENYEAP